jgi:hypothetical protein
MSRKYSKATPPSRDAIKNTASCIPVQWLTKMGTTELIATHKTTESTSRVNRPREKGLFHSRPSGGPASEVPDGCLSIESPEGLACESPRPL